MNVGMLKKRLEGVEVDDKGGGCDNYTGCDYGCPALHTGDCDNVVEVLECCDVDAEEALEIFSHSATDQ